MQEYIVHDPYDMKNILQPLLSLARQRGKRMKEGSQNTLFIILTHGAYRS